MKQSVKIAALLMSCLALTACKEKEIHFKTLPIPADKMQCVEVQPADRPKLAKLYMVDWDKIAAAPDKNGAILAAQAEVAALLKSVYAREATVSRYVIEIEDKLFLCSSNAKWLQDYTKKLEAD